MSIKLFFATLFVVAFESVMGTILVEEKVPKWREKEKIESNIPRMPVEFLLQPQEVDGCLYLTIVSSLYDFSLYIYDVNGCKVSYEQSSDANVIFIPNSNAYPYSVEIMSPMVKIRGEVVLE